jgi:[ribosomal protein S5]-alanine N-acetyltransferase
MPVVPPPLAYEPLAERHAVELHGELHDERLYRFIPEHPPRSLAALQREYAEFSGGAPQGSGEVWLNWAVREQESGRCVGTLQATRFADGLLWVGYKVVPTAWQRGIATSALGWLVHELLSKFDGQPILAAVDTRNHPSIRVLQKCHFHLLRREPAELHGQETEDLIYQFTEPGRSAA